MSVITFENHDCVFLHIAKTGGKSVQTLLGPIRTETYEWNPNVAAESLAGKWVFTFVRNPFDRFISSWCHALRRGWTVHEDPEVFLTWVLDNDLPVAGPDLASRRRADARVEAKRHAIPQTTPCYLLSCADMIYRFEDFSNETRRLCARLGAAHCDLHLNASMHAPWLAYYHQFPGLADLVRQWYAEDFAVLGYSTDLPAETSWCPCSRAVCERYGRCEPCFAHHSTANNLPACIRDR